ncbi:FAD-dependent oxidoreductase [Amycolatopsis umgeniensis]|uniref:2-polyprenyl-6-methoxyphenol hydroxylase-like FAD-dependent oxidoreductase n=1 Tax=Amycolatopsis umgeniensis TaxID=336628 RepID=A0A841AY47_9PSEU|nr:FAD-dependent oxidoreductase [Amycolatopsis umgeniensis]MBB5851877.1 2-polyprenyl-6-methoxyphenol hydroxylase-like FAD-dependent oxidoreductase [Amycolatopsis umgeniensis]
MERTQCCVVGGGPAGMVLGLLLARAGVEVTVLEKHKDFFRDFRGDTVHPPTLMLLDELGLGGRFAELPSRRLEKMRMVIGGTTIVAADFRRIPGPYKYIAMVPQWDFLNLLAEAAAEEPTFTLRMGAEVTGLRQGGGVRYRDSDGVERELAASLVVGCDGRDSLVRAEAGLVPNEYDVPMDVWWVRVPKLEDTGKEAQVFGCFANGLAGMTMDRGDYYQTSYLIRKGQDEAQRAEGIEKFRERIGGLFGWGEGELAAIRDWDDVKLLKVRMSKLPHWYSERVLCIGDAAHAMSPAGGMGVNIAVQDAVAAARILAGPLRRGSLTARDLGRVQRRRNFVVTLTQKMQLGEHKMLVEPALDGTLTERTIPLPLRISDRFPLLTGLSAFMGGIGPLREKTPVFARRGS